MVSIWYCSPAICGGLVGRDVAHLIFLRSRLTAKQGDDVRIPQRRGAEAMYLVEEKPGESGRLRHRWKATDPGELRELPLPAIVREGSKSRGPLEPANQLDRCSSDYT